MIKSKNENNDENNAKKANDKNGNDKNGNNNLIIFKAK